MTLREIDNSLPQGLHDSEINTLAYDRLRKTVTFSLSVYVGGSEDKLSNDGGSYKGARLFFEQALYFALDPPIELLNDQLHILSFEVETLTESGSLAPLPKGINLFKLFKQYRVLQIAAAKVSFAWIS